MKATLNRDDIALLIGNEIATWTDVTTHMALERRLRELADRIVDYAHLHYIAAPTTPAILPGLPGGA